ncbi:hypothetical protein [Bosea vestrisii]|uniref:Uncharacterized protein n=1 Tax=Bosea vestrisii TaxID=151416 RepID=A0ABW0HBZ8_9HYPH
MEPYFTLRIDHGAEHLSAAALERLERLAADLLPHFGLGDLLALARAREHFLDGEDTDAADACRRVETMLNIAANRGLPRRARVDVSLLTAQTHAAFEERTRGGLIGYIDTTAGKDARQAAIEIARRNGLPAGEFVVVTYPSPLMLEDIVEATTRPNAIAEFRILPEFRTHFTIRKIVLDEADLA